MNRAAAIPPGEAERLDSLRAIALLDTPVEERFDRVTRLLANLFEAPIALLSLVDAERQWFKSCVGLGVRELPRDQAFCAHAILGSETFVVRDATRDERFRDNPLVTSDPNIRFYAGHPLRGPQGHQVGTLCVIDRKSRELSPAQAAILRDLAAIVEREINLTALGTLQREVIAEKGDVEGVLHRVLPATIANELRAGAPMVARHYPNVAIMFGDLHGFSQLAASVPAVELVEWLNSVFSDLDRLVEWYRLEKIKTIGDAYMVAAGLPEPHPDGLAAVADMALRVQREVPKRRKPDGSPLQVRIGIHTGPVVAGVIGVSRFAFDLWGTTVNIAAQLESSGTPGKIRVSSVVRDELEGRYAFEPAGELTLKGGGRLETFFLAGRLWR